MNVNSASNRTFKATNSILSRVKARRREELVRLIAMTGATVTERARNLGVARQSIYDWMSGRSWPNNATANRISKLTGVPVDEIRPL
jgi:DNA-binding XRE family transcriptional regulator